MAVYRSVVLIEYARADEAESALLFNNTSFHNSIIQVDMYEHAHIPISVTASYLQPEPVSTAADLYRQYAQEAQVVPEHSSSASNSPVHSSSAPTGAGPEHTGSAPSTPGESQGRSPAQATSPASSLSSLSSDFSSACLSPTRAEQTSTSPSLDLLTCASPFLHRALYELGVVDTTANNMQLDRESVISIVNGQFAHQLDRTVNV